MTKTTPARFAALAGACLSILAGGCAAARACSEATHAPPSTAAAAVRPYRVQAADGTCLQAYEWKPTSGPARGAVVIVHGIRDHASRYAALAEALAARGLIVYSQDLRGHGDSGGDRQRFDSMAQMVGDADLAVEEAKKLNPGLPVFLYGHSMGGLISTEYALAHGDKLRGLVLSGAALKLPPTVSDGEKGAARFFSAVLPGLPAQAVDDTQFVRDPAAKKELAADPLVDHGNLPARSAAAALDGIDDVQKRMGELKVPVLILHGSADKATNPEGSKELNARAASADKTLKIYEGVFHDLMHEPERAQITEEVVGWITARLGAPGAAER
ncbi:MAG TPA: lysophospholipase [Myxococcales bacterium]|jgi:alpha-beta hydrolase superfamily lysophospholipase|nr:lysophospholipase [Myxococcales bacterium]